jgi:ParB family chromosome partitioning protein
MASARPRGLGRGLDALIPDFSGNETGQSGAASGAQRLPIEALGPNPYQPRRDFDEEALAELAASVREHGIVQPIVVRPDPAVAGRYQIIAGERRWRAAQKVSLHEVPVLVRDVPDGAAAQIALIENVQRSDLNPVEEAEGYRRLIDEFGHSQDALARLVGKSRPHIANMLRLLDLPDGVQSLLVTGALSAGHARALLGASDPLATARLVVDNELSVRDTEALVRGAKPAQTRARKAKGQGKAEAAKDYDTLALERSLSDRLGLRVSIDHRGEAGGKLTIGYASVDQLDALITKLNQ